LWLHEIKHDGFRISARKNGAEVRLYSRPGNDLTRRFPLIVETLARLRSRSCIIDGEASPAMTTALPRSISSVHIAVLWYHHLSSLSRSRDGCHDEKRERGHNLSRRCRGLAHS